MGRILIPYVDVRKAILLPILLLLSYLAAELRGRIRRDACWRDVCAHGRVLDVPQGHYKGPWHPNRGVVYSYDPEGRKHADNYRRHVCATREAFYGGCDVCLIWTAPLSQ
jgi:hypothetical protein